MSAAIERPVFFELAFFSPSSSEEEIKIPFVRESRRWGGGSTRRPETAPRARSLRKARCPRSGGHMEKFFRSELVLEGWFPR